MAAEPIFFADADAFRRWLAANHEDAAELLVGFWKKGSGKASIDWPRARDEALCFGWIDGVRNRRDAESYTIRFTPRREGGIWSKVNIARFRELEAEGRVTPAGARAFAGRRENTGHYSYEDKERSLAREEEATFRANAAAWADFEARPPSYRKAALYWVTSAKRPETRAKRLATLIADSAAGRRIGPMQVGRAP